MAESRSHILLVPGSAGSLRLLCDVNPKKAGKGHTIVDTDTPEAATCPDCKARLEVLQAPLVRKMSRAPNADLDRYYDWASAGDAGTSSKTIVQELTGAKVLNGRSGDAPHDGADFGRCYRMLKQFPELRARLPEMKRVNPAWAHLVDAWAELEKLYEDPFEDGRRLHPRIAELRNA